MTRDVVPFRMSIFRIVMSTMIFLCSAVTCLTRDPEQVVCFDMETERSRGAGDGRVVDGL